MFARPFAALLADCRAWRCPRAAQEQRGSIEGVVKDASGAVLPGVTVEATVQRRRGRIAPSPTASASYRFPSLPPGTYKSTANLQGFRPAQVDDVRVGLGQIKKVDFALPLSGVTETVQVTAESPLVDVKQSSRARPTSAPSRSSCCRRAATSRRSSRRRPAPTRKPSSAASRSTAPAPVRTATSSTASRRRTSRTASRARTSSPTSSKKSRSSRAATPRSSAARPAA